MLKKEAVQRQAIKLLCTDVLVPADHLPRKIDAAVDFTHIYDFVADLFCEDNGRPSCDPVVLFKLVIIQHLFGIRSLRITGSGVRGWDAYQGECEFKETREEVNTGSGEAVSRAADPGNKHGQGGAWEETVEKVRR